MKIWLFKCYNHVPGSSTNPENLKKNNPIIFLFYLSLQACEKQWYTSKRQWCTSSNAMVEVWVKQGSQNVKIPGSPSGRYSSDFGSPKIYLTSPNKIKTINVKKKKKSIHKYLGKSFILLFTAGLPNPAPGDRLSCKVQLQLLIKHTCH